MLAHLTDILTTLIKNLYISTGLAGILLAMAIESCCIPLPSEIVMPLAGVMVASGAILHGVDPLIGLLLVALAGTAGCLVGSVVAYNIGSAGGRPLMLKYGRYVLISQHDADMADRFFQRWGSATTFFSRLLPVVRTYISLPAGIARMPFLKFCVFTLLGSFPWCLLLAYVGYVLDNHLSTVGSIFHGLDAVILLAVVVLVILYVWRHIRNDRKARAEHAAVAEARVFNQQLPLQRSQSEQQASTRKQFQWPQGHSQQLPQSRQPSRPKMP